MAARPCVPTACAVYDNGAALPVNAAGCLIIDRTKLVKIVGAGVTGPVADAAGILTWTVPAASVGTLTIDPASTAQVTQSATGVRIDVPCEVVQDCVGPQLALTGLMTYNDAGNAFGVPAGAVAGQMPTVNAAGTAYELTKPCATSPWARAVPDSCGTPISCVGGVLKGIEEKGSVVASKALVLGTSFVTQGPSTAQVLVSTSTITNPYCGPMNWTISAEGLPVIINDEPVTAGTLFFVDINDVFRVNGGGFLYAQTGRRSNTTTGRVAGSFIFPGAGWRGSGVLAAGATLTFEQGYYYLITGGNPVLNIASGGSHTLLGVSQ
jgi:hypothetical protein